MPDHQRRESPTKKLHPPRFCCRHTSDTAEPFRLFVQQLLIILVATVSHINTHTWRRSLVRLCISIVSTTRALPPSPEGYQSKEKGTERGRSILIPEYQILIVPFSSTRSTAETASRTRRTLGGHLPPSPRIPPAENQPKGREQSIMTRMIVQLSSSIGIPPRASKQHIERDARSDVGPDAAHTKHSNHTTVAPKNSSHGYGQSACRTQVW